MPRENGQPNANEKKRVNWSGGVWAGDTRALDPLENRIAPANVKKVEPAPPSALDAVLSASDHEEKVAKLLSEALPFSFSGLAGAIDRLEGMTTRLELKYSARPSYNPAMFFAYNPAAPAYTPAVRPPEQQRAEPRQSAAPKPPSFHNSFSK